MDVVPARTSAGHDHINFYGRYDFTNPTEPPDGSATTPPHHLKPLCFVHLIRRPHLVFGVLLLGIKTTWADRVSSPSVGNMGPARTVEQSGTHSPFVCC